MTLDKTQVKTIADVLHQARFPRHKYGVVRCGGPKICCGQDYQMARALLRRFNVVPKAR